MKVKDNIEWLKSLKKQIGQTQHRDLWHFEQVIDETIANLEPLAKPHGGLVDADISVGSYVETWTCYCSEFGEQRVMAVDDLRYLPTTIEAEVNNEQRTKYAICRPYDGITLNTEVEFLLDHNGDVMLFDSESAAWEYFKPIGITEEEPNAIKVVEYKEGDLITDRECNDILERNDDCPLEEVSE